MKVAILSESPADEAMIFELVKGITNQLIEPISYKIRHRGVEAVFGQLSAIYKSLHFTSDAIGLVIVLDSDTKPIHLPDHDEEGSENPKCRICKLRKDIIQIRQNLADRVHLSELKVAMGLAVPSIEAWCLCGKDRSVTETAWINGVKAGKLPYDVRKLKRLLYGTDRPSLALETEVVQREALRVVTEFPTIEDEFPNGFGILARELRSWVAPQKE